MKYSQGLVLRDSGVPYIIFKYKGEYMIERPQDMARIALKETYRCGWDSIDELHEDTCADSDEPAFYTPLNNDPANAKIGDMFETDNTDGLGEYVILCTRKHGKRVWVSLDALKYADLNDLLHIKGNRYGKVKVTKGVRFYDGL